VQREAKARFSAGKLVLPIVLAAAAYLALLVYGRFGDLGEAFARFRLGFLVPILALALLNYGLRFVRWQYYLRRCAATVPRWTSAAIFFSGFAMSVTPARVGELLKCFMLRDEARVPLAVSVPVVIAERVTDVVAVCVLIALGTLRYSIARGAFFVAAAIVIALVIALAWSPWIADLAERVFARRLARRAGAGEAGSAAARAEAMRRAADTLAVLLRGRALLAGVALGTLAWFAECVAMYLVLGGLGSWRLSLLAATFVYALSTLAGALSLLPGGLGATELGMTALLAAFGVGRETAVAAVVIVRLCTLWFATGLGVAVYLVHRRRLAAAKAPGPDAVSPPEVTTHGA